VPTKNLKISQKGTKSPRRKKLLSRPKKESLEAKAIKRRTIKSDYIPIYLSY
jgi:hypothetical protein